MHKIDSLTVRGLGRAVDGTLVRRVLPGEEVTLSAEGDVRVQRPSTDRVRPPCQHFKVCGGCELQHASDEFVANWKSEVVVRALSAHGLSSEIASIDTSPVSSRRRAKLSGKRTKKGAIVGFHARNSDTVVEIPGCRLLLPELMGMLPALEELTVLAASRKAQVDLTVTHAMGGVDLLVETAQPLTSALRVKLADFAQSHPVARLTWNDEPVVMPAPPMQKFGTSHVTPPPGAFLQATQEGETALVEEVIRIVGPSRKVADLFCGCGTFTLPMAQRAEVHAVESVQTMLDALDAGWRHAAGLKRVTHEARDLFRRPLEADELSGFDAVVLDPPRAGAEAQIARLAESHVRIIAMVSCNPITFARDAATLIAAGFEMHPLTVVDQFRWSPHVEMVAGFTRA